MKDLNSFGRAGKDRGDGWRDGIESLRAERQRRHESPPRRPGIPLGAQVGAFFVAVFMGVIAVSHIGRLYLADASAPAQAESIDSKSSAEPSPVAVRTAGLQTGSLPVCSGGDRAARKITCIVDGDTG